MKPRSCVASSFSVKYRCPVFQTRQFDSSPSTQTSNSSPSSRSRILIVSSVTLSGRRTAAAAAGGGWGGAAGSGSGSSSSNGRSNRSDTRKFLQLVEAVAQALDIGREAGLLVGLDDHGVQSRVAGGGFELLGQRGEKPVQRRFGLDADDRIVRPGHADVGEIG